MPKRPFQSLQYPLSSSQVESLNSMMEYLFERVRREQSASQFTGVLEVTKGGSGRATAIPYSVIVGGISSTGAHQSVSDLGTAGDVLTSQGAGLSPEWTTPVVVVGLDDLIDVVLTAPADGDVLVFDGGSMTWVNVPQSTLVSPSYIPLVDGSEPPVLVSDGFGHLILVEFTP